MWTSALPLVLVALCFVWGYAFRANFAPGKAWIPGIGRVTVIRLNAESGSLKDKLSSDMKEAMKAKEKTRLGAIRSIQVAIKQKEVDDRVEVTDEMAFALMGKLLKQRKESIKSYQDAGRTELAESEQLECEVISAYLPQQLSPEEVDHIIDNAINKIGATAVKDMGKVIAELKPQLVGKADMSMVGGRIKAKLGGK